MSIEKMYKGFKKFREEGYVEKKPLIEDLIVKGQRPEVVLIACSDSRIDPAIVFNADPGDIFMVRNVANIVPPYESDNGHHGTSAALEYAVQYLGVKDIVVMGHAHCGGISALLNTPEGEDKTEFIGPWVNIVQAAKRRVLATQADAPEEVKNRSCEQHATLVSLENLTTFPCIREKVEEGTLRLHAWHIDIHEGSLSAYSSETRSFEKI